MECGLFLSAGVGDEAAALSQYGERTVEAAAALPRAIGIRYLVHETLRAAGVRVHPGAPLDNQTIEAALRADREIRASGGFSTIALTGTLSNLANKQLLAAYRAVPSVVGRFCRTVPHSDFKAHTKYRVTTPGEFDKVGATGELKHTELDEDTYSNQVETFGRMMALTRQMIRNDDLGAFLCKSPPCSAVWPRRRMRSPFSRCCSTIPIRSFRPLRRPRSLQCVGIGCPVGFVFHFAFER